MHRRARSRLAALSRGFGYLTLDPSPRLRRLRDRLTEVTGDGRGVPCPPLPDSVYPPGAVQLGDGRA